VIIEVFEHLELAQGELNYPNQTQKEK